MSAEPESKFKPLEISSFFDLVNFLPVRMAFLNYADEVIPVRTAGRNKRGFDYPEDELLFIEAVRSFHDGRSNEYVQREMESAFSDASTRVFEIIEKARRHFLTTQPTKFSSCVLAARKVAVELTESEGDLPTKAAIIAGVIALLGKGNAYYEDEAQRWTEVFREACLQGMPRKKQQRGDTRHGDK
jgi:hypothetical protein